MLIVAATVYCVDQNGPSAPFLLELDIPKKPTKKQLDLALRQAHAQNSDVAYDGNSANDREPTADDCEVLIETEYGDLRVAFKEDQDLYLFVCLPKNLKSMIEQFEQAE